MLIILLMCKVLVGNGLWMVAKAVAHVWYKNDWSPIQLWRTVICRHKYVKCATSFMRFWCQLLVVVLLLLRTCTCLVSVTKAQVLRYVVSDEPIIGVMILWQVMRWPCMLLIVSHRHRNHCIYWLCVITGWLLIVIRTGRHFSASNILETWISHWMGIKSGKRWEIFFLNHTSVRENNVFWSSVVEQCRCVLWTHQPHASVVLNVLYY